MKLKYSKQSVSFFSVRAELAPVNINLQKSIVSKFWNLNGKCVINEKDPLTFQNVTLNCRTNSRMNEKSFEMELKLNM